MRITCPQCGARQVVAAAINGARYVTLIEHHVPPDSVIKTSCKTDRGVDVLIDVQPVCSWSNARVGLP